MIDMNNEEVYIFFHLTKTAGTALRAVLTNQFDPNLCLLYNYYSPMEIPIVLSPKRKMPKYFIGHQVYYGMHEDIKKPAKYIVFLREPVSRMVSLYYQIYLGLLKTGEEINFKTWLEQYSSETLVRGIIHDSKFTSTPLEQAKNILRNTSFIGLQETFELDVEQLFYPNIIIGLDNVSEYKAKNQKVTLIPPTKDELQQLRELTVDDKELYEYAIQLRNEGHNKDFKLPL